MTDHSLCKTTARIRADFPELPTARRAFLQGLLPPRKATITLALQPFAPRSAGSYKAVRMIV